MSFDVYDIDSAQKAAKKLKTDKEFYNKCSEYSKQIFKEEFSQEKFLEIFYKNY